MAVFIDNTKYLSEEQLELNKNKFIEHLKSVNVEGMDKLILYLEGGTDFFIAPASTMYHGDYEGGLVEHSLNVYSCLKINNKLFRLGLTEEDMIVSALLHDLCKCNLYTKDSKWYKPDDKTWVSYTGFKFEDNMPIGHGEKSVFIIQNFIKLKVEVAMMIRWHMGMFDVSEPRNLYNAMSMSKGVVALHLADMQASSFLEDRVDLREIPDTPEYSFIKVDRKPKPILETILG